MEIRQLEYFREIATTGSINEAPGRLNMSQPPLSYQMKQLEAELNVTLFERTRTGVTLTEAGKLLYERAENLLNFVSSTRQEVAEAGKKRVLRIGHDADYCGYHDALHLRVCPKKSRCKL